MKKAVTNILILSLLATSIIGSADALASYHITPQQVLKLAEQGNLAALNNLKQQGYSLDISNPHGQTALCQAVRSSNKTAVQTLIKSGVNTNVQCMQGFSKEQLSKVGLKNTRLKNNTANYYTPQKVKGPAPAIWRTYGVAGALVAGGVIALAAGGGGGGGGGSSSGGSHSGSSNPTLTEVDSIPAINKYVCKDGQWINGVCIKVVSKDAEGNDADGKKPISVVSAESPYYLAEFGGSLTNTGALNYVGDTTKQIIAMQANGVSSSALSADGENVYLSGASSVLNASGASISMRESSSANKGVVALLGSAAGTVNNNGLIDIISQSTNLSAGIFVDRKDAEGVPGTGRNITNNGKISITDLGDGSGFLSGIYAPGRNITNKGSINILIGKTRNNIDATEHGTAHGLYGKNVYNNGTISLKADLESTDTPINTDTYLLLGSGEQETSVLNTGVLNINLTDLAYGIRGIWATAPDNVNIKNTGKINVSGKLYNNTAISKQIYLMGAESGVAQITNENKINVGTAKSAVDISSGGLLNGMYGIKGTLNNTNDIAFYLHANPEISGNTYTSYAMSLLEGTLTNNGNITYSFDNLKEDGSVGITAQKLQIVPITLHKGTATNNGTIRATLTGSASTGSSFNGIETTGGGILFNTNMINILSTANNVSLSGMKANDGNAYNQGTIYLKTTGEQADLFGVQSSGEVIAGNSGYVYLTHEGGSGNITGFGGGNSGLISINANDMTRFTQIVGLEASEEIGEGRDVAGTINISLTKKTFGDVAGTNNWGDIDMTYDSLNNITIEALSNERAGDLTINGMYATTVFPSTSPDEEPEIGAYTLTNSGRIDISASGMRSSMTNVVGMYALNASVINNSNKIINLKVDLNNSTNHFIGGMMTIDTMSVPSNMSSGEDLYEFKALNLGTINIEVAGQGATSSYINEIPFDVVGMATNSLAINDGNIVLKVDSETAKTAGMVAYGGGTIVNNGNISFTGTAANFTPMYGVGTKTIKAVKEEEKTEQSGGSQQNSIIPMNDNDDGDDSEDGDGESNEEKKTYIEKTTTETVYYATVYNYGTITMEDNTPSKIPSGSGYWNEKYFDKSLDEYRKVEDDDVLKDVSAQEVFITVEKCDSNGENCTTGQRQKDDEKSNTQYFNKFPAGRSSPSNIQTAQTSTNTLRINEGVRYVTELGASFQAPGRHLTGDVTAGVTLTQGSNKNIYVSTGSGNGALIGDGDYSDLNLDSNSILFDASYAQNQQNKNGIDIIMTRRSFNTLVNDNHLASFLEDNYTSGNNQAFFDRLKAFGNQSDLTTGLDKLTGKDMLSRFNFEDMTMIRELNFDMNNKLFYNQAESFSLAGHLKPMAFKGDVGSNSRYALSNKRLGNWSYGLGITFTNIKSDNDKQDDRRETMYQMVMPISYQSNNLRFVISPRLGYARGTYNRTGFDNISYDGTIEKQMFGLMNEARYPITVGDWLLEPSAEFNIVGYRQKGWEDNKEYSLNIQEQNTYSIESGIGFYLTNDKEISKNNHFKLTAGISAYHEFATPYELDVGMKGMKGSFKLYDEDRSDNRAVVRMGFDWRYKDLSIYGDMNSFIDKEIRSLIKTGLKIKF